MYDTKTDPVLIPVREAFDRLHVGVTRGYQLIGEGRIEAVKLGNRTMVPLHSLSAFIATLPRFVSKAAA